MFLCHRKRLLRGQDKHAARAVRFLAQMAEGDEGPHSEIAAVARAHADKMDAWPKKKQPDLPANDQHEGPEASASLP